MEDPVPPQSVLSEEPPVVEQSRIGSETNALRSEKATRVRNRIERLRQNSMQTSPDTMLEINDEQESHVNGSIAPHKSQTKRRKE